jgi:two-component system phosphate regulon sensor histidine kinase PhoR
MKRSKFQLTLLIVTLAGVIILVGIQVNWILTAARMQEAQFTHSVTMAMNRVVDNLSRDREICKEVSNCLREGTGGSCYLLMKNRSEWENIGSMIKEDLRYYGITLDFEFDIVDSKDGSGGVQNSNVYFTNNLAEVLQQAGYELRIRFPEKKDFILAQIGYIFITSIILLILVSVSIILIFRYYKKEKKLSENIVDLINNMTHEFRTPLTNIALANNAIAKNELILKDDKLSSYTKVISNEQTRLKERVDELLRNSFSEAEKSSLDQIININESLEDVISTFEVQVKSRNAGINLTKAGNPITIKGNIDSFNAAISNLIDNALKYNQGTPEININVSSAAGKVVIEVSDNGMGIPREYQEQVFTRYFRVPTGNVHNADGFGLGLYYVKNIVTSMGGTVKLSSAAGKGTRFTLEFPIQGQL